MYQVYVNQAGYYPGEKKMAVICQPAEHFAVEDMQGNICYYGKWEVFGLDELSQDTVYQGDFSDFQVPGRYVIRCDQGVSASFEIGTHVYDKLMYDVMRAFYFLRCGCALEEKHAGVYTHDACHTGMAAEWENHDVKKRILGGWHDAGDYGRYVTPGAVAVAQLLYAFMFFPDVFVNLELNIPETGNHLPDILNECKWELDWLLQMQREDGAVYHKLTTARHAPFVMPEEDKEQLYLLPITTIAAADFAAVCALASRVYRAYDVAYANTLLFAAQKTYRWLEENPYFISAQNPRGCGTGGYGERDDLSNRYWAAAEMFATTGEQTFFDQVVRLRKLPFPRLALGWGEVAGMGQMALLTSKFPVGKGMLEMIRSEIIQEAERLQKVADGCGYRAAMTEYDYVWGSNMPLMHHGMTMIVADWLENGDRFRACMLEQLHVLMGVNAMGISYVTGNGEYAYNNPHLRPAYADGIDACMPGMVSGGPNRHPGDAVAREYIKPGTPPMKSYIDHYGSYSMNEITIYWNSPVVFVLAAIMHQA